MGNHFNGDNVLQLLGEAGWGGICTCRRDRLPLSCKKNSFHNMKNVNIDVRPKAARYEQPIIAVKHADLSKSIGKKSHTLVHTSFQST